MVQEANPSFGSVDMPMRCPGCDFENAAGKKFCIRCGVAFGARCPRCDSENPPEASFCGDCGAALSQPTTTPQSAEGVAKPIIVEYGKPLEAPEGERRHLTVLFCDLVNRSPYSRIRLILLNRLTTF